MSGVTVRAHPNIALIKYWGKRDEARILPWTGSLSMTLGALGTTTFVRFGEGDEDRIALDGKEAVGTTRRRIVETLDRVRREAGLTLRAEVRSRNNFPTAAGLASSASGGAALVAAAAWAAGLDPDAAGLSRAARQNSGSACRSIQGGFCEWLPGVREDGADSYAVQRADEQHWPALRMVAAMALEEEKETSSREGMRRTVETSPFYEGWKQAVSGDLRDAREALAARDFTRLGEVAERNAFRMHAAAMGAVPPLCYLKPITLAVIERVARLRREGVEAYVTLDAGPNPVLLCLEPDVSRISAVLEEVGVRRSVVSGPGPGVTRLAPDAHAV